MGYQPGPSGFSPAAEDDKSPLNRLFWDEYNKGHDPILDNAKPSESIGSYYADVAWPHLKLIAELDSFQFHNDYESWAKDRGKDLSYALKGWRVIRLSGRQLQQDAHGVMGQLARIAHQCSHDRLNFRSAEALERIASVLERIEDRLVPSPAAITSNGVDHTS